MKEEKSFKEEQKELLASFLDIHCFDAWKILPSQRGEKLYVNSLEMMVSPVCNTACSYCYIKNYSDKLYPCDHNKQLLLENCEKIMKWLWKGNLYPDTIEIFSGEFFNLPFWKEYLNIIFRYLNKMPEGDKIVVVIPTNGTFFFDEKKINEIQNLIDEARGKGLRVFLSLSVDGKYLDNDTRPLRNGKQYDEVFYDRMFTFCARNNLSFHPMVGAKGIENWIKNFDWYVENIQKYYKFDSKWKALTKIYLLEVRNPDWKTKELEELGRFLNHVLDTVFGNCNSPERKAENLSTRVLNIFSSITSSVGRGLGCSLQQCLHIRMGDLALVQCHRTAYQELLGAYLDFTEEGELFIKEALNVNSYLMSEAFDFKHLSKCNKCPINKFCGGPCIGCNYEINRDLYTVVPTVCDLEYTKITSVIDKLDREDPKILDIIESSYNKRDEKLLQLRELREFIQLRNKEDQNDSGKSKEID